MSGEGTTEPIPRGWAEVRSGAAQHGDRAWSEASQSYDPVAGWIGTPAASFWRLIRQKNPARLRPWAGLKKGKP